MRGFGALAIVAGLIVAAAGSFLAVRAPLPPAAAMTPEPLAAPRVVIRKEARELALYDGDRLVRKYPVALAADVRGDKEREGDRKTPEGALYVCTRNEKSRFHKFLGLSYPDPADADRGLQAGMISRAEHDAIVEAHRTKSCPPWKTALGGEVGIHGGGSDRDWTLGCIALTNDAIDDLWAVLKIGDPVLIEP